MPPAACRYLTTLVSAARGLKLPERDKRELQTLAICCDLLAKGSTAGLGDTLMQRFKAAESSVNHNSWDYSKHLEIVLDQHLQASRWFQKPWSLLCSKCCQLCPPPSIGGSIKALDIAEGPPRNLLANPSSSIKLIEEWAAALPKAKMRISKEEWMKLGPELVRRRMAKPIKHSQLIYHNGRPLHNGALGVGKGKLIKCNATGVSLEVLRPIINLAPSNDLQIPILGDVATLPHFGQWQGLELLDNEVLVWDSEDIQCAFYVFNLPDAWPPWFVWWDATAMSFVILR